MKHDQPNKHKEEIEETTKQQTSVTDTQFGIFQNAKQDYDEAQVFSPNTKGLAKAWSAPSSFTLDPISRRLCLTLLEIKNKEKLTDCFSELSDSQERKIDDFKNSSQPQITDIRTALIKDIDLLAFLGLNERDIENIVQIVSETQETNDIVRELSNAIRQVIDNKPISFRNLSYNATLINAKLLKQGKINDAYELMLKCSVQRALIATVLEQENETPKFGVPRSRYETNEERAVTPLSTLEGRYQDQISHIKEFLQELKDIKLEGVKSEYVISTVPENFIEFLKEGDESVQDLNKNLDRIGKFDPTTRKFYHLYLRSAKLKEVETVLAPLKTINLNKLKSLSDKELFIELGRIYQPIADACPFCRGSASIAQLVICSLLKGLGKPLVPFSENTKVNPDILSSLMSKEKFANNFFNLFDEKHLQEHYDFQSSLASSKLNG
ncbi:hypothetical protein ACNVED_02385 [Legionella sp. D16C41]|uniref:hypothetical protein n=1 Tax=Legionella sp. D16C41 TaxID=3402688 RepID=UPI003AF9CFD4